MRRVVINIGLLMLASACGDASPGSEIGETVGTIEQAIVRGTTENSRQYVVAVRAEMSDGGVQFCSGVLFAPRTVLTAAHCVFNPSSFAQATRVLVYAGNNYEADIAPLLPGLEGVPPPPQVSSFMWADSWETHPSWDPGLIFPDLAAVYLDRKPAFDPLPVDRNRLGSADVGSLLTVVGYGATGGDLNGAFVKRRGSSSYAGPPLVSDAPPGPDQHPGIGNSTVVNGMLKINGVAPSANTCFGDSGGPAIKNRFGQDYVAGIMSWGTTDCETFSYHTRLDPFLPFVDESYRKGGQATVIPRLECIQSLPGSKYRAYYGYKNDNGINVQVPYGSKNSFARDTTSQRPTNFIHGNHAFDFRVTSTNSQTQTWKLSPTNSPTTTLNVTKNSPKCAANNHGANCALACEASLAHTPVCGETFRDCEVACLGGYDFFALFGCESQLDALNQCVGALPSSSFDCYGTPHAYPIDGTCVSQNDALIGCLCANGGC